MNIMGFHIPPALILLLMAVWGAASLYLFIGGVCDLLQINHEMKELFTKGNTAVISEQNAPAQVHFSWRLALGTASLGLAICFFRLHYFGRREY